MARKALLGPAVPGIHANGFVGWAWGVAGALGLVEVSQTKKQSKRVWVVFSVSWGKMRRSMRKYRPRSTFCSGRWSIFEPRKNLKNRDLDISKISNIDEVDRIYMASPRGLSGGKTEPLDYILMFCSANVPGITYKIIFGNLCPQLLKKDIWEIHQVLTL